MSLLKIPEFQLYLFSNTQSVIGGEKALLDAGVPCLDYAIAYRPFRELRLGY